MLQGKSYIREVSKYPKTNFDIASLKNISTIARLQKTAKQTSLQSYYNKLNIKNQENIYTLAR